MKTCTSARTWGRNSRSKVSGSLDRNLQGSHTDQGETEGEPPCCHTRLLSLTPRLHRHVPQRHLHPSWNSFPPPLFFWASSSASWFSCHTLGWSQKRTCYCRPPLSASSSAPSHTCRGVYFPKNLHFRNFLHKPTQMVNTFAFVSWSSPVLHPRNPPQNDGGYCQCDFWSWAKSSSLNTPWIQFRVVSSEIGCNIFLRVTAAAIRSMNFILVVAY